METLGLIILTTVISLLVVSTSKNGKVDVFSPISLFVLIVFVGCILRGVNYLFTDSANAQLLGYEKDILIFGYLGVSLALIFYLAGYLYKPNLMYVGGIPRKIKQLQCSKAIFYLLLSVSLFASHLFLEKMNLYSDIFSGNFGAKRFFISESGVRTSLSYLEWGFGVFYILFLVKLSKSNGMLKKIPLAYWLCLLVAIGSLFVTSQRSTLVLYLFFCVYVYYSSIKKTHEIPFVKIGITSLIVVGAMGLLRTNAQIGDGKSEFDLSAAIDKAIEHTLVAPYGLALDKTAIVINKTAENGNYLYGNSFLSLAYAVIPRVLWEDKPSVRIGQYVGKEIYLKDNLSGVPPGFVGELFINFSWIGIVVGMFLYGTVSRYAYEQWRVKSIYETDAVIYSIFLLSFGVMLLVADFVGAMMQFVKLLIPYLVMKNCIR